MGYLPRGRDRERFLWPICCWMVILMVGILIVIISVLNYRKAEVPKMNIYLNGVNLDEINNNDKNIKYHGNELLLDDNGTVMAFDDVEIKGRGNASWQMDKKSYRIKLLDKVSLLGIDKTRKWGLISNRLDGSFLRNDLAQYISGIINGENPTRGEFVELLVDDENVGLYYLTRLIEIGKNSVDLRDEKGVLVELDNAYCEAEDWSKSKFFNDCIALEDVVVKGNEEIALGDFMESYDLFEQAVLEGNYTEAAKLVDMESWANYYLLSEFTSNPDVYVSSTYLYKDGEDDVIHAGLGWDFDAAFGNYKWGDWQDGFYSPLEMMARFKYLFKENEVEDIGAGGRCRFEYDNQYEVISPLMCYLVDMPEFRLLVGKAYREKLMNRRDEIISYLSERIKYINDAAMRDDMIWGKNDFAEEAKYLTWWIECRFQFFDMVFGDKNGFGLFGQREW